MFFSAFPLTAGLDVTDPDATACWAADLVVGPADFHHKGMGIVVVRKVPYRVQQGFGGFGVHDIIVQTLNVQVKKNMLTCPFFVCTITVWIS